MNLNAIIEEARNAKAKVEIDFRNERVRVGVDPDGPGDLPVVWGPWVTFDKIKVWAKNARAEARRLIKRLRKMLDADA